MQHSQSQLSRSPTFVTAIRGNVALRNGGGVLNSWKEIAAYLGSGVRTVQRWEREAGLPIHRPYRRKRTSVLALKSEIDAWVQGAGKDSSINAVA